MRQKKGKSIIRWSKHSSGASNICLAFQTKEPFSAHTMIFFRFKMARYSSGPQILSSRMQQTHVSNWTPVLSFNSLNPTLTEGRKGWFHHFLQELHLLGFSQAVPLCADIWCVQCYWNRKKPKVQIWMQKKQQISVAGTSNRLSVAARQCHFAKHARPYRTCKLTSLATTKSRTIKFLTHQCCFQCGLLLYVLQSDGTLQLKELDNEPVLWAGQNSVIPNCRNSITIQFTSATLYGYCFCGNLIAHFH